jgi:hypothetical protein
LLAISLDFRCNFSDILRGKEQVQNYALYLDKEYKQDTCLFFVDYRKVILPIFLGFFILSSFASQIYAIEMTTVVIPSLNEAQAQFTGDGIVTITYDPNSALSKNLTGFDVNVKFKANMSTPGMQELVSTINQALNQKQTTARIQNATLDYNAQIHGTPGQLKISYLVRLKPLIQGVTLPNQNDSAVNVIDMDWRSFVVPQPLNLQAPGLGEINVNYPIGLIQAKLPNFATQLAASDTEKLLEKPIFDFTLMGQSLDSWHFLFDPTGSQAGMLGSGFEEIAGAKVVSIFSLGESSFREGTFQDIEQEAKATIDGTTVNIHTFKSKPSGQIQIAGFAQLRGQFITASEDAPQGTNTATGGFPLQVLLILGGMMGAVAVFVLFKARK